MQKWVPVAFAGNAMLAAALAYNAPDFSLPGWARFVVFVGVAGTGALLSFFGHPIAEKPTAPPELKVVP